MRLRRSQQGLDDEALVALGRRIGEARHSARFTRTELAERIGVAPDQYARFEAGEDDPSRQLVAIAQITGASVEWLRGDEEAAAPAAPEPEPEPEPQIEEEQMHQDFESEETAGQHDAMEETAAAHDAPAPQPAAAGDNVDFSEDDLTRVLTGLSRQRDALASSRSELDARAAELDERERMLSEREDHIGGREDAVSARENEGTPSGLGDEWEERLQSFEETNRQYAAAATALADWAAELRGEGGGSAEHAEAEHGEVEEPNPVAEHPELGESAAATPLAEGDDFPEDF